MRKYFLEHMMIFNFHLGTTLLLLAGLLERSGVAAFGNDCADGQVASYGHGLVNGEVDVLIIGLGWAGIGAGREIQLHNDKQKKEENKITYIILEAASFIGGRAVAAHWIAGGGANPVGEFAWDKFSGNKNSRDYLLINEQKWSDVEFFEHGGELMTNGVHKVASEWAAAYECLQERSIALRATGNDGNDESIREALSTWCKWDPTDGNEHDGNLKSMLEWFDLHYEFAQDPSYTSTKEAFPLGPYGDFQDTDWFVSDRENCARIARKVADEDIDPDKIVLNSKVCLVDWDLSEGRATVYSDEECDEKKCHRYMYRPKKVISTVSEGYLDWYGDELFAPNIMSKLDSMRKVYRTSERKGMAIYKELNYIFDRKWWGDFQFMAVETDEAGRCNWWQSYETRWSNTRGGQNEFFADSHTLVCVLTTEVYEELFPIGQADAQALSVVKKLLVESLGRTLKYEDAVGKYEEYTIVKNRDDIGPPGDGQCHVQYFDDNEFWKGSYANWQPSGTKKDFEKFAAPLSKDGMNVVHFAGEATCYRQWGYQHGAYYSGIREAYAAMKEVHHERESGTKFPAGYTPTDQFCEVEPDGGKGNLFVKAPKIA